MSYKNKESAQQYSDARTFTFRIPNELFKCLEAQAQSEDRSKGAVIRTILNSELGKSGRSSNKQ